jgi:ERCC4-type nuclease
VYLIEGMFSQLRTPVEKKMILSAITTMNIFKGFSVHRTSTLTETAEWIIAMCDKMDREIKKGNIPPILQASGPDTESNPLPYCSVVKKVKRENITPANIGEIILCQIPGISSVTAVAIMQKFSSFSAFMDAIKADPACLDGMTYQQNGKQRKINKTILENVKSYLLSTETSVGNV